MGNLNCDSIAGKQVILKPLSQEEYDKIANQPKNRKSEKYVIEFRNKDGAYLGHMWGSAVEFFNKCGVAKDVQAECK